MQLDRSTLEAAANQLGCGCPVCRGERAPQAAEAAPDEPDRSIAVGGTVSGTIDPEGDVDVISFEVVAGETYMVSLRGTGDDPLVDPYLTLFNDLGVEIAHDDDGGQGINSLLTFTAVTSGTWEVTAAAYPDSDLTGGYTVDLRQLGADSVPDDLDTDVAAPLGTSFGAIETDGDVDVYSITLTEGNFYTFEVAGGVDYETEYPVVPPGEIDTKLTLLDADGNVVAFNDDRSFPDDISSGIGLVAEASGTYYLQVEAYPGQTAGYALDVTEANIRQLDPLDTIDWGSQLPSDEATVYFAPAGETYDDVTSLGWSEYEIERAMAAFDEYAQVSGLSFAITDDPEAATFKLVTTTSADYLGYFNPPGEPNQGVGVFAVNGTGWDTLGTTGGLEKGGYGYITLVHEFGHALGLAHPHDNGGTSQIMPGVIGPFGSYGVFDLNQGVYTTMSYNDGWQLHPDAVDGTPPGNPVDYGWQGGPSAFDIALIQQKYGVDAGHASGDTVYRLPVTNVAGTFWTAIWDGGGTDTMITGGPRSAVIDLTAATLDYSPTGGGVISWADGVFGGFTIAHGVVIENATGGGGDDTLIGNAASNRLDGRGGTDALIGGKGDDRYLVDDLRDAVVEGLGGGEDAIFASVNYLLADGIRAERLAAAGGTDAITLIGNAFGNLIVGNAGDNALDGRGGADRLQGAGGDDRYRVDHADDIVIESSGNGVDRVLTSVSYALAAGAEIEMLAAEDRQGTRAIELSGSDSANLILGNAGNNVLHGRGGGDRLGGGGGRDRLEGGTGADLFLFDSALDEATNVDTIGDFNAAADAIILNRAIFSEISRGGGLAASAFQLGTAARDANDRILYHEASGRIFYDADGAGGAAAILFARVDPGTALTNVDFIAVG
ncbi:MAG TPA: pre-peptidase C-terminal domain-containing protein [Allosphingosinicella sp.]|nr:pre-peptidase C-terminal domain-containing protein [Allosphingosinicella sp.]